jgi:hypothetical protein
MSTTPAFFGRMKLTGKRLHAPTRAALTRAGAAGVRKREKHGGTSPMMLIISILALIGALRFRKQARAAGIGQATEKRAAA